jgi:hypothetical protein
MTAKANIKGPVTAVLDDAHLGHIQGAFGTILHGDVAPRESARTTKLYDRRNDQVTLDQVERIVL